MTPPVIPRAAVDFLQDIPDKGVHNIFTWATLASNLRTLADQNPDSNLSHKLYKRREDEGLFVHDNRIWKLFAEKYGGFENAIPVSPVYDIACQSANEMRSIFTEGKLKGSSLVDALDKATSPLRGDNYSVYVRPSSAELANATRPLLEKKLTTLPTKCLITIEKCLIK
jgi:hypothetical protein